jgi:uncharacterized protein (TIGR02284 family)
MNLRDPVESAVNDVARRAEESANLYEDAAGRAEDAEVSALFERLGGERRAFAERLGTAVESMGELPEDPDPDAEWVHRILNAARSFFDHEDAALLADRDRAEEALGVSIDEALAKDLPDGVRKLLEWGRDRVRSARSRLRSEGEPARVR